MHALGTYVVDPLSKIAFKKVNEGLARRAKLALFERAYAIAPCAVAKDIFLIQLAIDEDLSAALELLQWHIDSAEGKVVMPRKQLRISVYGQSSETR